MRAARPILLFILTLVARQAARAQLLTENPLFPVDVSSVTITVDCSLGNQGLMGYAATGDVYVHVGLITSASTSSSDWRYVPFTWGTTNAAAHAVPVATNKYQYTISNIRSFFGVPAGEKILKIAVLFRNGNGSLKQANSDGSDMYLPVYDGTLASRYLLPPFQPTYIPIPQPIIKSVGDSLTVEYAASQAVNLGLYFNGTRVDTVINQDSVQTVLHLSTPGNQQVIATANDGTAVRADTLSFYVAAVTTLASPPAGTKEGINYLPGDTSVILLLFAPHKSKILVVGDFSNWTQQTAYQMNETPDSNYFWLRIDHLHPNTEYAYQYVIDDSIVVADYNTEKVLDKNVDPGIPAATYPGLRAFPANAPGSLASVIRTAKPAYTWQVTNFQRPPIANLRIYELLVRDFTAAGNWQGLIDTLGYLSTATASPTALCPAPIRRSARISPAAPVATVSPATPRKPVLTSTIWSASCANSKPRAASSRARFSSRRPSERGLEFSTMDRPLRRWTRLKPCWRATAFASTHCAFAPSHLRQRSPSSSATMSGYLSSSRTATPRCAPC